MFTGSNCSSSSEGETIPTALHAGICVRQQSVSIKDAIIAREALSLLVTCLQLRCQQLCKTPTGVLTHYTDTPSALCHILQDKYWTLDISAVCNVAIPVVHFLSYTSRLSDLYNDTKSPAWFLSQVLFITFHPSMISSSIFCWDLPAER